MVTHIVGGGFGVVALVLCVVFALVRHNYPGFAGGLVYGIMMIFLYTISSVYHGLIPEKPKKVMQVLDHCSIFALILGTYVPFLLTGIREQSLLLCIILSSAILIGTAVCVTFTAIDHKRYAAVSMTGYFAIGWAAIFALYPLYKQYGLEAIIWLVAGGLAYTLGIIFYAKGVHTRYMHSVFHLFILAGTAFHFVAVFKFCILQLYTPVYLSFIPIK
jgi:hemolysin III